MLIRIASVLALGVAAVLFSHSSLEGQEMNRSELNDLMQGLFAAAPGQEYAAARKVAETLADRGLSADISRQKVNQAGRVAVSQPLGADEVIVLRLGEEVYLWQPADPAALGAFLLE